jgi:tight adherence protein C
MNLIQLAFLALVFLAVFGMVYALMARFAGDPVQHRLQTMAEPRPHQPTRRVSPSLLARAAQWLGPLAKLSGETEDWEKSALRTRFMNAGLRHPSMGVLYFSAKTTLAVFLPLVLYVVVTAIGAKLTGNQLMLWLLVAAAAGYYLPNYALKMAISYRQREVFETFPDALDLMTVCVEAGLAMDAALLRVADEIGIKSPVLAEELHLVTLELRAGLAKERALRNLALRTGVEDVDALVAMLIQAERFGTSIADSLRVQSDQLRTRRRQRAEEAAAKIALKLLFPLIFFIFPSLLVVLMGPAFISIYRVLLPAMAGNG